ncbi:MAG: hypothetical protein KDG55_02685 [Rhodocyclaceae bacterium]|nr:hypothetical protein [Rhodocyclaceae bacterium]
MHPLAAHLLKVMGVGLGALLGVAAFLGFVLVLVPALFLSGAKALCGNGPVLEVPSPDGGWKAVVFERDCGATAGVSSHVSVIGAGAGLPDGGGSVFIAYTGRDASPAGSGGGPAVSVTWVTPSRMRIVHPPWARLIEAQRNTNGIRIDYLPARASAGAVDAPQ